MDKPSIPTSAKKNENLSLFAELNPKRATDNSSKTVGDLRELDRFRVSDTERFQDCPARWAAEKQGAGQTWLPSSPRSKRPDYARIGTAVHSVCEAVVKGVFDPEYTWEWPTWERDLMKAGLTPEERDNCLGYCVQLKRWARDTVEVVGVEAEFVAQLDRGLPPLAAHPDILGWDPKDEVLVIRDHKTNRQIEDEETWAQKFQPRFYTWMLRLLTEGRHPIRYEIGYVNKNTVVSWITDPRLEDDLPQVYRNTVEDFRAFLRWGNFPEIVNPYCNTCPRFADCAAAAGMLQQFAQLAEQTDSDPTQANGGSLLQRYAWTKAVLDVAQMTLDLLRDEVSLELANKAEGCLLDAEAGMQAVFQQKRGREARFSEVYRVVLEDVKATGGGSFPAEDGFKTFMEEFDQLFTVRFGALDRYVRHRPDLALSLVSVIKETTGEGPTLVVKRVAKRK